MPGFMKQHGYRTYVFHGNTQLFYDRGQIMEELGFDHVLFKEQLSSRRLKSSIMGVRDAELIRCVLGAIESEKRAYVFAITLDTHSPYDLLEQSEMEVFPRPASPSERYFNSARYLDNCLKELIDQLPDGTTVVMYGDHTASLNTDLFLSDVVGGMEYVACLIYQKGKDLSQCQLT
jgi:phosphoglycerol transferase MdoB-like AlkP superfamily enzyme